MRPLLSNSCPPCSFDSFGVENHYQIFLFWSPDDFLTATKERPQEEPKIYGTQRLSQDPARSSLAGPNTLAAEVLELHLSSGEDSEPDDPVQQIPAISSLQIGDNVLSMDLSFKFICLDQRVPGLISSHIAFIVFFNILERKTVHQFCTCQSLRRSVC